MKHVRTTELTLTNHQLLEQKGGEIASSIYNWFLFQIYLKSKPPGVCKSGWTPVSLPPTKILCTVLGVPLTWTWTIINVRSSLEPEVTSDLSTPKYHLLKLMSVNKRKCFTYLWYLALLTFKCPAHQPTSTSWVEVYMATPHTTVSNAELLVPSTAVHAADTARGQDSK